MALVKRTRFVRNAQNPNGATVTEDVEQDHSTSDAASAVFIADRAETEAATAQYGPYKTALKNAISAALADLDQEEARADSIQTQALAVENAVATLLTTIAAAPVFPSTGAAQTPAVIKQAVDSLRSWIVTTATQMHNSQGLAQHMQDAALGAKRNIVRTRQIIKLVCSQAGIPVPQ